MNAIPQLRPTNILADGSITFDGAKNIAQSNVAAGDLLVPGEVLFNNTNSSAWVGKSAVFANSSLTVCSNHVTRLVIKPTYSPQFIAEVLNVLQRLGYFTTLATNFNNQAGVNNDTLLQVRLPLGAPSERSGLLARLDAARAARDAGLEAADAALAGVDAFILGELGLTLPPNDGPIQPYATTRAALAEGRLDPFVNKPWYKALTTALSVSATLLRPLGALIVDVVGGATPSRADDDLCADDGIPLLRINNIRANEIVLDDCRFITAAVHDADLARSQLSPGDVLMTITGLQQW